MQLDKVARKTKIKCEHFWCSVCDNVLVDSDDEETGQFFKVYGHTMNLRGELEDYTNVVFAVCSQCLNV